MKSAFALAAAALVGAVAAQSLGPAPAGCDKSYDGNFEITIVLPSNTKRDVAKRQDTCGQDGILTLNLHDGNLMDVTGKTGYIASNNSQFQFDKPVQAGGIYAGEFSVCKNGSLALGPTTTFYQCQSGGFYNLYYSNTAEQCSAINIDIIPCAGSSNAPASSAASSAASVAPVSVSTDGQPQATKAATTVVPVSVYTDGQPQATARATSVAPVPVSVYTDGQPQATVKATAKSNVTAAAATATPTIATGSANQMTASFFLAGAMAVFAMF